jgi:predicted NUDIX family phosphoesterase/predicted ATPase
MKKDLQIRAETLAEEFRTKGRKPVVIEFAGAPKAGKTRTLSSLRAFLKRCGFKAEVVIERASMCPIRDKQNADFNIWTACTTLAQILEKTQYQNEKIPHPDSPEILILDRGLFDALIWLAMMEKNVSRIKKADREVVERFLLMGDWRKRISGVIVMTASPEHSMEREQGDLPVEGVTGSIMNLEWLSRFKVNILQTCERLERNFRIFQVDTSQKDAQGKPRHTAEKVAGIVLDLIAEQLEENILCAARNELVSLFAGKACVTGQAAMTIASHFVQSGSYVPRAQAESSKDLLQALPIIVVRNRSGRVLKLRRREKSPDNPLNDRIVIWAGGHVRKEDATNGDSLVQGAMRELHEELRLRPEADSLRLVGAIYTDVGGSTSKHVALVYQWTAESDDVDIVLSGTEFFERRGTSLKGNFVEVKELKDLIASRSKSSQTLELWSELIVREILGAGDGLAGRLLL